MKYSECIYLRIVLIKIREKRKIVIWVFRRHKAIGTKKKAGEREKKKIEAKQAQQYRIWVVESIQVRARQQNKCECLNECVRACCLNILLK